MECRLASEFMMKYLDKDISDDEHEILMKHIENCNDCRNEFSLLKEGFDIVESTIDIEVPYNLEMDIMNNININKYKKKSMKPLLIILLEVILISFFNVFITYRIIRGIDFKEVLVKGTIEIINFISYTLPNLINSLYQTLGKVYEIMSKFALLGISVLFIIITINILFIKFININFKEV